MDVIYVISESQNLRQNFKHKSMIFVTHFSHISSVCKSNLIQTSNCALVTFLALICNFWHVKSGGFLPVNSEVCCAFV